MPRTTKRPTTPPPPRVVQTELFPRPLVYERLDPRAIGGAHTRVADVYLVRQFEGAPQHRVFHDRHGWYCEEHGADCALVPALRLALSTEPADR